MPVRKLVCFALPFSLAVLLAVAVLPGSFLLPVGIVCIALGLLGSIIKRENGLRLGLICFGLASGLLWTAGYQVRTLIPAAELDGASGVFTVQVTDWPRDTRYGIAVNATLKEGGYPLGLVLYGEAKYGSLRPGDTVTGEMRLKLAHTIGGEESDYYYTKRIFLSANARGELDIRRAEGRSLRFWPVMWREALREQVMTCFPVDVAPLVTGLVMGDKSGLDTAVYTAFQRTGVSHVIAVSGLHVSFLAGFMLRIFGKNRRRTAFCTIAAVLLFAGIAGYTPSVLRAAFLQTMVLLAPLLGRQDDKATSLSAALMLILLPNPYAIVGVGLQLSFAAVAGIYCFTGPLFRRWTAHRPQKPRGINYLSDKACRFVLASLSTTLGALVFTTPLTAFHFGTLSLIAPLTNLLVLSAVSLTFAGGLGVSLLGLVHRQLAVFLGHVFALPGRYVLWVVGGLNRFSQASVPLENIYIKGWLLLVYVVILLALILRRREPIRPIVPVCACLCGLCAALVCGAAEGRMFRLSVSVLDVGQGQSVAFTSRGNTVLVDCGGSKSRSAGDIAADYLQSSGYDRLDLLILTHFHTDHAGGVRELLERMEVGMLMVPDVEQDDPIRQEILALAEEKGTQIALLTENTDVTLGETSLRVYRPLGDGGANEEGLTVLCTLDDFDTLITGDMNTAVEKRLIKYGDLPDIELLVAGHHGSKYATSSQLLEEVTPEYVAVSVGYNSYGHPAPETLERLFVAGCNIYRTDWMGNVTFRVH